MSGFKLQIALCNNDSEYQEGKAGGVEFNARINHTAGL